MMIDYVVCSIADALMNNKDYLMTTPVGAINTSNPSSVPLYRRQGLTMGNGHQQQLNSTGNSGNSTGGHSLSSSTPDNMLTGSPNDILAGLTTGSSTLIEALFQQDQQQNNTTLQKLLYNNFNATGLKNDIDLFMGNNAFVTGLNDGLNNTFHTQNFQQPANNIQQHPANNTAVVSTGDNRNTTYAAVLSQGPQQQDAAVAAAAALQQHHKQNHNHNFQHSSMMNNLSGNGLALGLTVGGAGTNNGDTQEKDPFAAIRELGQGTNGFYNYFQ